MNARVVTDYFLNPIDTAHRRYEVLRSVFIEELSLQEVAQRFGVSYGTVRNWVSEFRRDFNAGQPPPFSLPHCEGVPRAKACIATTNRKSKSPTRRSCRWNRDADWPLGTPVCSYSCRCSLGFVSIVWSAKPTIRDRK